MPIILHIILLLIVTLIAILLYVYAFNRFGQYIRWPKRYSEEQREERRHALATAIITIVIGYLTLVVTILLSLFNTIYRAEVPSVATNEPTPSVNQSIAQLRTPSPTPPPPSVDPTDEPTPTPTPTVEPTETILEPTSYTDYQICGELTEENEVQTFQYIPPYNGIYLFTTDNQKPTATYSVSVDATVDDFNFTDGDGGSISPSGDWSLIALRGGVLYNILVEQVTGYENFTVNIVVPDDIKEVEGDTIVGKFRFKDQENRYIFTAPLSGDYTFELSASGDSFYYGSLDSDIYDENDFLLCGQSGGGSITFIRREFSDTITLAAGYKYVLTYEQRGDSLGEYSIKIIPPSAL